MEYWEFGVDVPGVKTPDPVLVELIDAARSVLLMLTPLPARGTAGDIALRLGGEAGMRKPDPRFEVLSIRGVRKRLGGRKGEYAWAGLGLLLFDVRGRASGVIDLGSTSIKAPVI
jgi:hypothetical protein